MPEPQKDTGRKKRTLLLRILSGLPLILLGPFRAALKLFRLGWRGLKRATRTFWRGLRLFTRWFSCGFMLFRYSSKRLFTLRTTPLAVLVLAAWLYITIGNFPDRSGDAPLEAALTFVLPLSLLFAIFLSMNVLPRESESGTVEVFFSLPVRRYRLVIWHLATIAIWLFFLLLFQGLLLSLMNPGVKMGALLLRVLPSLICISCLTLWISTYTRNGPAAGLFAGLICFSHLFRFRSLGPIQLFQSPFLPSGTGSSPWGVSQVILVGLITLLLIMQINERLKKSELWFH